MERSLICCAFYLPPVLFTAVNLLWWSISSWRAAYTHRPSPPSSALPFVGVLFRDFSTIFLQLCLLYAVLLVLFEFHVVGSCSVLGNIFSAA
jgi:hypothetical protein